MAEFVKFTDVSGLALGMAKQAVQLWTSAFSPSREGDQTKVLMLRAPPWPAPDFENDLRVVNWPVLQLSTDFQQVLAHLEQLIGRPLARVAVNKLVPLGQIEAHLDETSYCKRIDRLHFVLQTNDKTAMICGEVQEHLPEGTLWVVNRELMVAAYNGGEDEMIHLILDVWKN